MSGDSSSPRQISGVRERARRPGRYRLEVDGRTVTTVDAATIAEFKLRLGLVFTEDLEQRVLQAAARLDALDRALNALSTRSRGSRELERWLARKGLPQEAVSETIARLTARGLIDDLAFARGFARARAVNRGQSRRRIEAELARRGVARETTTRAVAEVFLEMHLDDRSLVEAAATRKLRSLTKLDPKVRRRRLFGFLARQGYPSAIIAEVVAELTRVDR